MKRKLIDIDDPTYEMLKKVAAESGTNLKQYIEGLLDDKVRRLEDGGGYRFSASREPSDRELAVIMKCAAESANMKRERAQEIFFSNLEEQIRNVTTCPDGQSHCIRSAYKGQYDASYCSENCVLAGECGGGVREAVEVEALDS